MNPHKPEAGGLAPRMRLATLDGAGLELGGEGGWRVLVVYRGIQCPICGRYLKRLAELAADFAKEDIALAIASADTETQARAHMADLGFQAQPQTSLQTSLPVAFGMTDAQMRALGLYISHPREAELGKTDHDYPEPGVFVVNPEGRLQIVDISNAPFARPDMAGILRGVCFVRDNGYPIRGTS